jgi:MtN3 and saliva related transmembrane protein
MFTSTSMVDVFGGIAFVTSMIGIMPQVWKAMRTKSTRDVSMVMLINYMICSISWVVYGSYTDAALVVYSNIVGLIVSVISIWQKWYYDSFTQHVAN